MLFRSNLILDVTYSNTTNLDIYLPRFIVLKYVTSSIRFVFLSFLRTEGVLLRGLNFIGRDGVCMSFISPVVDGEFRRKSYMMFI